MDEILFDVIIRYEKDGNVLYQKNYYPNLDSGRLYCTNFRDRLPDRSPTILREWELPGSGREFFNRMVKADEWYKKLIEGKICEEDLPLAID